MKKHSSSELEALLTQPPGLTTPTLINCSGYDPRATQVTLSKLISRRGWYMTTRLINGHIWVWGTAK